MNIIMLLCAVFYISQCETPETLWNIEVVSKCWDPALANNFALFAGGMHFSRILLLMSFRLTGICKAYSAFMDIVLAMLPWSVILRLQMKTKEKLGVACAMSLGLL